MNTGKRYRAICPVCNKVFYACKSLGQECGELSAGSGSCIHCGTFLNLTFISEEEGMKATPWEEWLSKRRKAGCDKFE